MRYFYISFLFLLFAGAAAGQTIRPEEFLSRLASTDLQAGSRTVVTMAPELDRTLNREENLGNKTVKGFRIDLYRDNSQYGRDKSREVLTKFRSAFPDITGDTLIYESPDWKVVVGNCRTRDEANIILGRVKSMFGSATIRQEDIPLKNFLRAPKQSAVLTKEEEAVME